MKGLIGRKFQLLYGVCKVTDLRGNTVILQNVDNKKDIRKAELSIFLMALQNGIIKEV